MARRKMMMKGENELDDDEGRKGARWKKAKW